MFRCTITSLQRLPRKPLLALAVLALALVAGGLGAAQQAAASATTPYQIEVTWNRVKWSEIDDGFGNFDFELYGTLQATNLTSGVSQVRMIGDTGNPGRCRSGTFDGSGPCFKTVGTGLSYFFSNTPLSANTTSGQPAINYAFNNHKVVLTVRPGETFRMSAQLFDYDATSGNDNACITSMSFTPTEAQLQGLSTQFMPAPASYEDGDATCFTEFLLRRV